MVRLPGGGRRAICTNFYSGYQYRIKYHVKYVLYMYNLGTAPNVQNLPEIAACTPGGVTWCASDGGFGQLLNI